MDYTNLKKFSIRPITGIYFLLNDTLLVYIGQSKDILRRIQEHRQDKVFTHYCYFECKESELNALEQKYIKRHNPKLNITFSKKERALPEKLTSDDFTNFFGGMVDNTAKLFDEYLVAKINESLVYSRVITKKLKHGKLKFLFADLKSEISTGGSVILRNANGWFMHKNKTYYFKPENGYFSLTCL